MKQKQIRCPYCGSIAILRDASYVYGNKAKDGKLYVCSHFPQCNSYVGVHPGTMQNDLMRMGDFESFLVKGQFNCVSDNRTYKKPFIPIVTEYALLLKKTDSFIIPFSIRQEGVFSVQNTDILALTWHHLIRMTMESIGGRGALKDLYDLLKEHPKAKKNPHYQERIRATLYEHPDEYIPVSKGYFRLSYPVT